MAKKQNMSLVYVAIAVVLALFLLYVFFSMSKESFETRGECYPHISQMQGPSAHESEVIPPGHDSEAQSGHD